MTRTHYQTSGTEKVGVSEIFSLDGSVSGYPKSSQGPPTLVPMKEINLHLNKASN